MSSPMAWLPRLLLTCLLLIVLGTWAQAAHASPYDPKLGWYSLETPHFQVHYHDGLESLARTAASKLEVIHTVLTEELDWEPERKTDVVLVDNTDTSNGFASTLPTNTIVIYVTAPMEGTTLDFYQEWLTSILLHEYTHILHIDTIGGFPALLRKVFGRLIMTNDVYPRWVVEGYAVFQESANTEGGRARSATTDMILRMAVLEGQQVQLGQAEGFQDTWPSGNLRYLWGGMFITWVAEQYGREKWVEFSHVHASALNPFAFQHQAREVFGRSIRDLWDDWQAALRVEYAEQLRELEARGRLEGEVLVPSPGHVGSVALATDGDWIYFGQSSEVGPSAIYRVHTDGTGLEQVVEDKNPRGLALSPDGATLYYAAVGETSPYHVWFDVFSYDLEHKKSHRITRDARVREPTLSPDGRSLMAVSNEAQQTQLVWIPPGGDPQPITHLTDLSQFGAPDISPDGTSVVVSAVREGQRDIYLYDINGQLQQQLTRDRWVDMDPTFSADGRFVVFSSDRGGHFDLYAWELATQRVWQLTRVLGGAFQPHVTPDGRSIIFTGYTSRGYDLRSLPFRPEEGWEVETQPSDRPRVMPAPDLAGTSLPGERDPQSWPQATPYRAGDDLLPRFVAPQIYLSEQGQVVLGAWTFARDPLPRHSYNLWVNYHVGQQFLAWGADYSWLKLRPDLSLSTSTQVVSLGPLVAYPLPEAPGTVFQGAYPTDYWYNEVRSRVAATASLPYQPRRQVWLRYSLECREPLEAVPGVDTAGWDPRPGNCPEPLQEEPPGYFEGGVPDRGNFAGMTLGWRYRKLEAYPRSISVEKGQVFSVTGQIQAPLLGSDYTRQVLTLDWRGYHPTPVLPRLGLPGHVVAARAAVGIGLGDRLGQHSFRLGGSFGDSPFVLVPDEYYPLRGYGVASDSGDRLIMGSVEYRLPLFFLYKGLGMLPFFYRGTHLALFTDVGAAYEPVGIEGGLFDVDTLALITRDLHLGSGAELYLDTVVGYGLGVSLRLGYARAWEGANWSGPDQYYLQLGSAF